MMTHTLVIETQLDTDYQLMVGLAQRLGLRIRERSVAPSDSQPELFGLLFGSWVGDETGDELNEEIRQARQDSSREIDL